MISLAWLKFSSEFSFCIKFKHRKHVKFKQAAYYGLFRFPLSLWRLVLQLWIASILLLVYASLWLWGLCNYCFLSLEQSFPPPGWLLLLPSGLISNIIFFKSSSPKAVVSESPRKLITASADQIPLLWSNLSRTLTSEWDQNKPNFYRWF